MNSTNGKEHRNRGWASIRLPLDSVDGSEAVSTVEVHRVRLRIHTDADAAVVAGHLDGELQDEAQETPAKTLPAGVLINGQARQPEHRQGVARQLLSRGRGKILDLDVAWSHSREPEGREDLIPRLHRAPDQVCKPSISLTCREQGQHRPQTVEPMKTHPAGARGGRAATPRDGWTRARHASARNPSPRPARRASYPSNAASRSTSGRGQGE